MAISQDGKKQIDLDQVRELSIQARADEDNGNIAQVWWFNRYDESLIAPWWSPQRDYDLRAFWMMEGNDILQGAVSSLTKKFKAMAWTLNGPQRPVNRFQQMLSEAEFGAGWAEFVGKIIQDYLTQDRGAFAELIGAGNPDGPIVGPVLGMAHLDAQYCQLTGDIVYPVLYNNAKDNRPHKLHATRVAHFVDMPSPNETMNGIGFCGVSRVVASSQVLLKLAQYKNEQLSDMPAAGLLLLNNIAPNKWDDVTANHEQGRRKLGHELWSNIITLIGIDPAQPITADFLNFASLPESFDELQSTNIYLNILALAFGVDPREFWPITEGRLGSGAETTVQHTKAKGKLVGEVIAMFERFINWKILPASVFFEFDFQDDEEDQRRAEINATKIESIMKMWQPADANSLAPTPVSAMEIRQMLADNVEYFSEEFLEVDITEDIEVTDTDREDAQAAYGPRICVDHKGHRLPVARARKYRTERSLLQTVEQNYRDGLIDLDTLVNFRLGMVADEH